VVTAAAAAAGKHSGNTLTGLPSIVSFALFAISTTSWSYKRVHARCSYNALCVLKDSFAQLNARPKSSNFQWQWQQSERNGKLKT